MRNAARRAQPVAYQQRKQQRKACLERRRQASRMARRPSSAQEGETLLLADDDAAACDDADTEPLSLPLEMRADERMLGGRVSRAAGLEGLNFGRAERRMFKKLAHALCVRHWAAGLDGIGRKRAEEQDALLLSPPPHWPCIWCLLRAPRSLARASECSACLSMTFPTPRPACRDGGLCYGGPALQEALDCAQPPALRFSSKPLSKLSAALAQASCLAFSPSCQSCSVFSTSARSWFA